MATLFSPIKHSVTRKFKIDVRTVKERTFDFTPGEPCKDIPDEYAKDLIATYPEKYFSPEDWEARQGEQEKKEEGSFDIPDVDALEAEGIHTLKKIADSEGIKYAQNISAKTLAERIHKHYTAPEEDTATQDEAVSEGE